jgi:hypothetical protein
VVNDIIDTMTFGPMGSFFPFVAQAQEPIAGVADTILAPSLASGPSSPVARGDVLTFHGTGLAGLSIVWFEDLGTGALVFAPTFSVTPAPGNDAATVTVPADVVVGHNYTVHFITFGRLAGAYATNLKIASSP